MRRFMTLVFIGALVAAMLVGAGGAAGSGAAGSGAAGSGAAGPGAADPEVGPGDVIDLPKLVRKWQGEKLRAADLVAQGLARVQADGAVQLPNGNFVDYELESEDHIVSLLVEFTDPVHNQIAEPDRTVDNSTYWISDFNKQHYVDMLFTDGGASYGFPSMRDYYRQVSSGRYTVTGQVSNWLPLPYPESEFGANATGPGGDDANGPVYRIVEASLQAAAASADDGIDWSPSIVDVYDRYDCDGDGNFDESDGYVDHFTMVHAGEGEEAGGGAQGGDAIWSHRSYANSGDIGVTGPPGCPFGGYEMPGTGLWVGDYTIEPENGAVGVHAHEFGHDLGLPDLYERVGANENSVSYWDVMDRGSWASDDPDTLDTKPVHMGAWDKLVLGWLDLATASLGDDETIRLGPAEGSTPDAAQAIRVNLPDYEQTETLFPPDGADPYYYYSGQGDNLDNTMRQALDAPLAAETVLTFRTNYDIETDWDYAYVQYSTDGGANWLNAEGNLSTDTNPNGQNFGNGITGASGGWVDGTYTVPAGTTDIGFRYWTDGAVVNPGFAVDSISLGGGPVDDASDPSAWELSGFFQVTNGEVTNTYFHYYLVESRNYVRNDTSLCGAYNFLTDLWLEKQCYANGVLIWYRNSRFPDNDVSLHPGGGQILVVDSHPAPNVQPDGSGFLSERWQTWDSTFGFERHAIRLHQYDDAGNLVGRTYKARPVPAFFDRSPRAYYNPQIPFNSVLTAGSGLRITLLSVESDGMTYMVRVH